MQTASVLLIALLCAGTIARAFEFDIGTGNNFAPGSDYLRSVGTRRDLSITGASAGGSVGERPSAPRRLIQPPPLKRSVADADEQEKLVKLYRWLALQVPEADI